MNRTPFDTASDEVAAEEWRAQVAKYKQQILRRRSRWHLIKSWLRGRVVITITWKERT